MASKIKISTDVLESQATRLQKLAEQISDIHLKAGRAIALIHEATNSKYSWDMKQKGDKLLKNANQLSDKLYEGAKIAVKASTTYQNTDKVIRDLVGKSLPDDVKNSATSGQTVVSGFQAKVDEMKQKEGFRQGDYWGNNSHYVGNYKGCGYINAWSCCAKAKQMQIEVTGKLGVYTGITDASQIQPGDVVHYYYWSKGVQYQHWVFVTAVNGSTISVGEGNAWDGKNTERVNYRDMDISEFGNMESIYR